MAHPPHSSTHIWRSVRCWACRHPHAASHRVDPCAGYSPTSRQVLYLMNVEAAGKTDVAAACADICLKGARLHLPRVDANVVDRDGTLIERQANSGRAALGERDLLEALELHGRLARHSWEREVQLGDLGSVAVARVGQREGDAGRAHVQVGVAERGEAQPVAERERRLQLQSVIVPVAHEEALGVVGVILDTGPLRRAELPLILVCGEGHGQPSSRGGGAPQQVDDGVAVLLARHEGGDDGVHRVAPWRKDGAGRDGDHNHTGSRLIARCSHGGDECIIIWRPLCIPTLHELQAGAILPLARLGAREDNGNVRFCRGCRRTRHIFAVVVGGASLASETARPPGGGGAARC
mmetsp:Transcript_35149/g.88395  ORF Transcript_35149/g.88395 Transcript_35149/m.88395 type:complete len:351 (+) Transcript_35149:323-1375(+)